MRDVVRRVWRGEREKEARGCVCACVKTLQSGVGKTHSQHTTGADTPSDSELEQRLLLLLMLWLLLRRRH